MSGHGASAGDGVEAHYVVAALAAVASLLVLQAFAGWVREAVSDEPSYVELVETCLTERDIPFEPVSGDFVALSAARGALRTSVDGNVVTIALGGSEHDAQRVYGSYASVGEPGIGARLERRRKVVFLWDEPPSSAQRDFAFLCTRDAQE